MAYGEYYQPCLICGEYFESPTVTNYCQKPECQVKRPNRYATARTKKVKQIDKLSGVSKYVKRNIRFDENGKLIK